MGKEIDAKNSLIFDKRTDSLKASFGYLNEEGYFSDCENFSDYEEGTLTSILVADDVGYPYESMKHENFSYFIPKDKVVFKEETKIRPYKDIEEFKTETKKYFSIGDTLLIRERKTGCVSELLYSGYMVTACSYSAVECGNTVTNHRNKWYICLGAFLWTLEELTRLDFCINDTTDWFTFGVEE